jgi:hypothetical protein
MRLLHLLNASRTVSRERSFRFAGNELYLRDSARQPCHASRQRSSSRLTPTLHAGLCPSHKDGNSHPSLLHRQSQTDHADQDEGDAEQAEGVGGFAE